MSLEGMACCATLHGHSAAVLALDALRLPSGRTLLASGGKDNTLRLWVMPAGNCIGAPAARQPSAAAAQAAGRSCRRLGCP